MNTSTAAKDTENPDAETPAEEEAPEPSVLDEVAKAFDDEAAKLEAEDGESEDEKPEIKPAAAGKAEAKPTRDASGKFAKKETPEDDPEPAAAAAADDAEATPPDDEGEPKPVDAPEHWSQADKDHFATVPVEHQEWLLGRHAEMEGDYTRKMQVAAPYVQFAGQWNNYFRSLNVPPQQVLDVLARGDVSLRYGTFADRIAFMKTIGKEYGLTKPGEEWPGVGSPESSDYGANGGVVPAIPATVPQENLAPAGLVPAAQPVVTTPVLPANPVLSAQIAGMREEKGDDGEAKYPYFDEVLQDMVGLAYIDVSAHRPITLEGLYDKAVIANPSVRAKADTLKKSQDATAQSEQARKKAAAAKKRASTVRGSPASQAPSAPAHDGSVRSEVVSAYDEAAESE